MQGLTLTRMRKGVRMYLNIMNAVNLYGTGYVVYDY
jgi:hypothetical protein